LVQVIRPGERGNRAQIRAASIVTDTDPVADQVTTLDAIFDLLRYIKRKKIYLFN
jgi:hypothetical protein